jgi:hypothetical protein
MTHVCPVTLWEFGCRTHLLKDDDLAHLLVCDQCGQLLDQIEESLDEIAGSAS